MIEINELTPSPIVHLSPWIIPSELASLANLETNWGSKKMQDGSYLFTFLAPKQEAVTAAIQTYSAEYLAKQKRAKLEEIAEKRRSIELHGPQGTLLDDSTTLRLTAATVGFMINPNLGTIQWELSRGNFTELTDTDIFNLSKLSVTHVQACFDRVYELTQEVNAIQLSGEESIDQALAELNAIDISVGWP